MSHTDIALLAGIVVLFAIIIYQQIFFLRQVNQLIDKLMSRSFVEYKQATRPPEPPKVKISDETPEDLRVLQEFASL